MYIKCPGFQDSEEPGDVLHPAPAWGGGVVERLFWAPPPRRPLPATLCALLTALLPLSGKGIARPWKLVYYRAKKMFDVNNYKGR